MDQSTFFTDHWQEIEPQRKARYEQMFVWRDGQNALLEPAGIESGHVVLDVGAGPGFFALALADKVGASGVVHGVDINRTFVDDANERAKGRANVSFHAVTDHRLPFDDATFDRVVCKNVLEYVPDLAASLAEVQRVLKSGGRAHVIDSDWGFVVVEPWGPEVVAEFFEAAAPAFREPYVGRRVPGALIDAGFARPSVAVQTFTDQQGQGLNVLTNMASYIETFGSMPSERVERLLADARQAVDTGKYLFCLPQFLITGEKP